jgi:hypothetical protein
MPDPTKNNSILKLKKDNALWIWTASDEAFAGAQSSSLVRDHNDLSDAAGYLLGLALLLERRLDGGEE